MESKTAEERVRGRKTKMEERKREKRERQGRDRGEGREKSREIYCIMKER